MSVQCTDCISIDIFHFTLCHFILYFCIILQTWRWWRIPAQCLYCSVLLHCYILTLRSQHVFNMQPFGGNLCAQLGDVLDAFEAWISDQQVLIGTDGSWVLVRPRVALDVDEVLCRTAEAFCTWHLGQPATDLTETGPTESRKQHFFASHLFFPFTV